jgi:hypothetical protein
MGIAALTAALWLGHSAALAQDTTSAVSANTAAPDTIGPRGLEGFSLNGTVTRPADSPAATARPAPARRERTEAERAPAATAARTAERNVSQRAAEVRRVPEEPAASPVAQVSRAPTPASSLTLDLPPVSGETPASGLASAPATFSPQLDSTAATLAPAQNWAAWPWLLLALVLGVAAAFLWRRRRAQEALAGGPSIDAYVAPEPAPPAPAPPHPAPPATREARPLAAPKPVGVVSTNLRPWVDLEFTPLTVLMEDHQVTFEFELNLYNSGGAPAREVLVEASIFNAGPNQDRDIAAFFAQPAGNGEPTSLIPPLRRMTVRPTLVAPRSGIQPIEFGGRQVFVPLIAFNATYPVAGGEARTSAAYLVGGQGKGEKLKPFPLDIGPRAFTRLGALAMPSAIRR